MKLDNLIYWHNHITNHDLTDYRMVLEVDGKSVLCKSIEIDKENEEIILKDVEGESDIVQPSCKTCCMLRGTVCEYYNKSVDMDEYCIEWEYLA